MPFGAARWILKIVSEDFLPLWLLGEQRVSWLHSVRFGGGAEGKMSAKHSVAPQMDPVP